MEVKLIKNPIYLKRNTKIWQKQAYNNLKKLEDGEEGGVSSQGSPPPITTHRKKYFS